MTRTKMTPEEAQKHLIACARQLAQFWANVALDPDAKPEALQRTEGMAFSMLCILDGVSCGIDVATVRKAMRGPAALHELFAKPPARESPAKPPARFDWSARPAPTHCPECGEALRPGMHLCYGGMGEDVPEGFIDPDIGDR